MGSREIIKKCIELGSSVALMFYPKKCKTSVPNREENWKKLQIIAEDHPIYSINTFVNNPIGEKVDLCLVIPFYNVSQDYVEKCMESLLNQKTEYSYRIVCVDDGSSNDTLITLQKYEQKYPNKIVVNHQENAGISCARNKGISLSYSNYVGFIDQDDWVDCNYVQKLLKTAYLHKADVVKCSHVVVKDEKVRNQYLIPDIVISEKMDKRILEFSGMIWSGIYSKELLEKVRFPEAYWYEDMIARLILYRAGRCFVSIHDTLYFKRKHDKNASTILWNGKKGKCFDHLYLVKHLIEENKKIGLDEGSVFYKCILHEMGQYLMWRTRGQSTRNRRIAFYEACYVVNELVKRNDGFDEIEADYVQCFRNYNYVRWLLVSWKDWAMTR